MEIWNRYKFWRKYVLPNQSKGGDFFSTEIGWRMIWVFDDKVCFTITYPEDY